MHIVVASIVWSLAVAALMLLNRAIDVEIYFVLLLLGLIILVELPGTAIVRPPYLRRMMYVIAVGALIFGWIVASKILGMLT